MSHRMLELHLDKDAELASRPRGGHEPRGHGRVFRLRRRLDGDQVRNRQPALTRWTASGPGWRG
jgi:hypothetical protein